MGSENKLLMKNDAMISNVEIGCHPEVRGSCWALVLLSADPSLPLRMTAIIRHLKNSIPD